MKPKGATTNTLTPIGQVLEGILDRYRMRCGGGLGHLAQVWKETVGAPLADHAKPFALKGSLLLVHVSSSAWLHQLHFLKADLLEKVNRGLDHAPIEDIKFKIGPV